MNQLVCCKEFELSLQRYFGDVRRVFVAGCFVDDFATIAMEAPELSEKKTIHRAFIHVGESIK